MENALIASEYAHCLYLLATRNDVTGLHADTDDATREVMAVNIVRKIKNLLGYEPEHERAEFAEVSEVMNNFANMLPHPANRPYLRSLAMAEVASRKHYASLYATDNTGCGLYFKPTKAKAVKVGDELLILRWI